MPFRTKNDFFFHRLLWKISGYTIGVRYGNTRNSVQVSSVKLTHFVAIFGRSSVLFRTDSGYTRFSWKKFEWFFSWKRRCKCYKNLRIFSDLQGTYIVGSSATIPSKTKEFVFARIAWRRCFAHLIEKKNHENMLITIRILAPVHGSGYPKITRKLGRFGPLCVWCVKTPRGGTRKTVIIEKSARRPRSEGRSFFIFLFSREGRGFTTKITYHHRLKLNV